MSAKTWRLVLGILCLVAAGVQAIWFLIIMGLDLQLPGFVIALLVLFPGALGWMFPAGFVWLWKDEINRP